MRGKEDLMSLLLTLVIAVGLIVECTPGVTPAATLVPPTATLVQLTPTVLASTATPKGTLLGHGVIKVVSTSTAPEVPEDWVLVWEKTYTYRDEDGHLVEIRHAEYREPPTVAEIIAYGEELSFEICSESTTWERPAEQEQSAKWWSSGRYAGGNEKVIKYPWTHNFFVVYGSASGEYDITNLSGLWTLPGDVRAKCFEPERHDAIFRLQTAEVWVLLHRVKTIKRVGIYYVIIVEPTEEGVQFVQFARPECHLPLTLYFVTEEGQEIERIVEAESPYWPYPQLIPTSQP